MSNTSSMRTPLKRVRRLGSAKEGADHFWMQRVTAVSNLLLVGYLVLVFASVVGGGYATVRGTLAHPVVAIPLGLFIVSMAIHMRLGMQVIIEDYFHSEGAKVALLLLNTFFAILVGATGLFAVLKMSFGA
jgi:succinate dehydrogenase / fumarate reductase, membrane anchor subunit